MASPIILDGKSLAAKIENELEIRVSTLKEKTGRTPVLALILVGDDPASAAYVKMKENACLRTGVEPRRYVHHEDTSTEELLLLIEKLNMDDSVHGLLLQHPLPMHIDEKRCFDAISLKKDVDGVNVKTFGRMSMGQRAFYSASPLAILSLLKHYGILIEGRDAVVVGRSPILGKPAAMMLLNENATVTICHSKTRNLPDIVKRADILVAAVGKPRFIQADWLKDGVVLIDTGYNSGNVGDIDLDNAVSRCSAYTPVPGGVGPMTIISLIQQTVEAAEALYGIV